jgi:hypothetical protein
MPTSFLLTLLKPPMTETPIPTLAKTLFSFKFPGELLLR